MNFIAFSDPSPLTDLHLPLSSITGVARSHAHPHPFFGPRPSTSWSSFSSLHAARGNPCAPSELATRRVTLHVHRGTWYRCINSTRSSRYVIAVLAYLIEYICRSDATLDLSEARDLFFFSPFPARLIYLQAQIPNLTSFFPLGQF